MKKLETLELRAVSAGTDYFTFKSVNLNTDDDTITLQVLEGFSLVFCYKKGAHDLRIVDKGVSVFSLRKVIGILDAWFPSLFNAWF